MGFFNEKIVKLGLDPNDCVGGYRVTVFDRCGALIEGHKGILSIDKNEITVRLKKTSLTVKGKNLKIVEINPSEIYVSGSVSALEYSE